MCRAPARFAERQPTSRALFQGSRGWPLCIYRKPAAVRDVLGTVGSACCKRRTRMIYALFVKCIGFYE